MKKIIMLTIMLFLGMIQAKAQSNHLDSIRPLKIGDRVPDIIMGEVSNYFKKEMRISDFKGKLLILDFWATGCAPCIAAIPKMEKLQAQFDGQIQIVLANGMETLQEIDFSLKKMNVSPLTPSLPMVSGSKILKDLFPHRGVPHHVWIDKDGIVQLIGSDKNTHEKKIMQLLNGESIEFIRNSNSATILNAALPYELQIHETDHKLSSYSSIFTSYNNEFNSHGRTSLNYFDTLNNTIRNTFVNIELLDLFKWSYLRNESWENKISGPSQGKDYDAFILKVNDTLRYTGYFHNDNTDEMHKKSRFCYEQIYSANYSEYERKIAMFDDLNLGIRKLYDSKAELVKRIIPCYYLVRIGREQDFLKELGSDKGIIKDTRVKIESFIHSFYRNNGEVCPFVFDSSEFHLVSKSMKAPEWRKGAQFDDLISALKIYGFDLIKGEKEVDMILITEM